jgi:hypothetical protein
VWWVGVVLPLYRVTVYPNEVDAEGMDKDEWFYSLDAARRRRRELIKEGDDYKYGQNFRIDRVRLKDLPPKALILACLHGDAVESVEEVVAAYRPKGRYKELP